MVGLPMAGIGSVFYVVLLIGMGATKLWRWSLGSVRRLANKTEAGGQIRARTLEFPRVARPQPVQEQS